MLCAMRTRASHRDCSMIDKWTHTHTQREREQKALMRGCVTWEACLVAQPSLALRPELCLLFRVKNQRLRNVQRIVFCLLLVSISKGFIAMKHNSHSPRSLLLRLSSYHTSLSLSLSLWCVCVCVCVCVCEKCVVLENEKQRKQRWAEVLVIYTWEGPIVLDFFSLVIPAVLSTRSCMNSSRLLAVCWARSSGQKCIHFFCYKKRYIFILWCYLHTSIGVTKAILPTSSSVCIIFFMRA